MQILPNLTITLNDIKYQTEMRNMALKSAYYWNILFKVIENSKQKIKIKRIKTGDSIHIQFFFFSFSSLLFYFYIMRIGRPQK